MTPAGKPHDTSSFLKDVKDGKDALSVLLGVMAARLLAATRTQCVATLEVATGLGDILHDLRAIAGLEHNQLRVFLRLIHALLLFLALRSSYFFLADPSLREII